MEGFPNITPRLVTSEHEVQILGTVLFPNHEDGPIALMMGIETGTEFPITVIASAAMVLSALEQDGVNLAKIDVDRTCKIAFHGWPVDWPHGHNGFSVIMHMIMMMLNGASWDVTRETVEKSYSQSRSDLN